MNLYDTDEHHCMIYSQPDRSSDGYGQLKSAAIGDREIEESVQEGTYLFRLNGAGTFSRSPFQMFNTSQVISHTYTTLDKKQIFSEVYSFVDPVLLQIQILKTNQMKWR